MISIIEVLQQCILTDIHSYSFGNFIDEPAYTRFFAPKVYKSDNPRDVQQLLDDLESIVPLNGLDYPEYGMSGISRVFKASTISDPDPFNHILLFTDAPPKDYSMKNAVQNKLIPPGRMYPHTFLHGFLPNHLLNPCVLPVSECYRRTGHAYKDLITDSKGILVNSLTEGGFSEFITKYNDKFGESFTPVSCSSRRKRSLDPGHSATGTNCKYETVSEFARKLTLLVTPQNDRVLKFTVTPPTSVHGGITKSAMTTQLLNFDDPQPGRYSVCADAPFELDVRIENNFSFSVEFFNPTSDVPYLITLPPPGCPVNVTMFSPSINKLSLEGAHLLELVSTAGSVIDQIPLINSDCSSAYIRASGSINLPNEAFTVRFAGVSRRGHSFEASLIRQYVTRFPPLQIRTTTAPDQITRGSTAVYSFQLTTTKTYPGCHLRLPISIEAQTHMKGVTLSADSGGTFTGSYTFSVRVTVSSDAPVRSGAMTLRVYDSKRKIIVQSTPRIGVEVSVCTV